MSQPPTNPIPGLFQRAMAAQNTGKPDVAQKLYARILGINPHLPEVHYQLGRLEMGIEHPKRALQHLKTARVLKPTEPVIWTLMMDAQVALKSDKGITRLMQEAKAAALPKQLLLELLNKSRARNRGGVAWIGQVDPGAFRAAAQFFERGQFAEARAAAQAILVDHPDVAPVLAVLAASQAATGEIDPATANYEKLLTLDPNYVEGHLQYGQLLTQKGDTDGAREHLETALLLAPKSALVNKFLGILNQRENQTKDAISQLQSARKTMPDDEPLLISLAAALIADSAATEAMPILEHLMRSAAPNAEIHMLLGNAHGKLDENDAAIAAYHKALELEPESVPVLMSLAFLYQLTGDYEKTAEIAVRIFARGIADGTLFSQYVRTRKLADDDPIFVKMEQAFAENGEVEGTRTQLAFALAKVHEDNANYARAFRYFTQANDALKQDYPVVSNSIWASAPLQRRVYDRGITAASDTRPPGPPHPIFVTGMPRSGTTLCEQIIVSHSRVAAGGELPVVSDKLRYRLELADADESAISGDALRQCGEEMREIYRKIAAGAEYITDKSIANYLFIGPLATAMPDAKIIVVRRDPRDNCLSMFKNSFVPGDHRYTTDLIVLADAYISYLDTLKFWRDRCPDAFYEIRYEALIADPESEARKLIDACGLPWEDRCLEFYKTARTVRTLSTFQVRQPIYSASVGAWKHFEHELQPLITRLEDAGALDDCAGP